MRFLIPVVLAALIVAHMALVSAEGYYGDAHEDRFGTIRVQGPLGPIIANPPSGDVIRNPASDLHLELWTDRGGAYRIGDPIELSVRVSRDAYVTIYNITAHDEIIQVFPNPYDRDPFVKAGETLTLPRSGYTLTVYGPTGTDRVIAIASTKRAMDLLGLAQARPRSSFAEFLGSEEEFGSALLGRIVAAASSGVEQGEWNSQTISFEIRR